MRMPAMTAAAALMVAACTTGTEAPPTISDITVETDLTAIQSREAVEFWQSLSSDLETALAAEFAGRIDPSGNPLVVDIDELSMQRSFGAGVTVEDANLSGRATLVTPGDGFEDDTYTITASSSDVIGNLPENTDVVTISPTSDAYYRAIVQAFARGTADAFSGGA